jgi:hypothetical protein
MLSLFGRAGWPLCSPGVFVQLVSAAAAASDHPSSPPSSSTLPHRAALVGEGEAGAVAVKEARIIICCAVAHGTKFASPVPLPMQNSMTRSAAVRPAAIDFGVGGLILLQPSVIGPLLAGRRAVERE